MREHYCPSCGLFFWKQQYKKVEGVLQRINVICPNRECFLHEEPDSGTILSVDTMGFFYYSESNAEKIKHMGWSSPCFAHSEAIEIYRKQGIPIIEV